MGHRKISGENIKQTYLTQARNFVMTANFRKGGWEVCLKTIKPPVILQTNWAVRPLICHPVTVMINQLANHPVSLPVQTFSYRRGASKALYTVMTSTAGGVCSARYNGANFYRKKRNTHN
jgi:hypothetical protein